MSTLRSDLLKIPGVEFAELEGDVETPAGVRVRLAADVDSELVGEEIRRVLAAHGLRSELAPNNEAARPVIPHSPAPQTHIAPVPDLEPEEGAEEIEVITIPAVVPAALAAVAVEEGRTGVSVVATAGDGSTAEQRARSGGDGIDEAVVAAVANLLQPDAPPPLVVVVEVRQVAGTEVVTVLLDAGGVRVVGAALIEGGRPYAVGRAVWAALTSV